MLKRAHVGESSSEVTIRSVTGAESLERADRIAVEEPMEIRVAYGEPDGDSATARTVSLPAAAASRLILDGRLTRTGVHIPSTAEIYGPILAELESRGIRFKEWSQPLDG